MKDEIEIIGHVSTSFPTKFGLPRQSGLVDELAGRIVFEKKYRIKDAVRGLEDFDYIWVIWKFSEAVREKFSPTVRPPRLGGNTRMGVFATRSPFRPNPIGLSCLRLRGIDYDSENGPELLVSGIDMMDGTPVYDVKPYIEYADARCGIRSGFAGSSPLADKREVVFVPGWDEMLKKEKHKKTPGVSEEELRKLLELDPRPSYHDDPERVYGFLYAGYELKFRAEKNRIYLEKIMKPENGGEN